MSEEVVQPYSATVAKRPTAPTAGSVVVGLDCDYVCSRHRRKERHFEVVVGKVIDAHGVQHRFAYPQRPSGFGRGVQAA